MTKQYVRERVPADVTGCLECRHYEDGEIFEFCKHPASQHSVGGVSDFHTAQHMREKYGRCGPDRKLKAVV